MNAIVYCVYEDGANSSIRFLHHSTLGDSGHTILTRWSGLSVVDVPTDEQEMTVWNMLVDTTGRYEMDNGQTWNWPTRFYQINFYD